MPENPSPDTTAPPGTHAAATLPIDTPPPKAPRTMSEELIGRYEKQLAELQRAAAGKDAEIKDLRKERRDLREKLANGESEAQAKLDELLAQVDAEITQHDSEKATLTAQLDEWKSKATAAPDEKDATIADLKTQIRTRGFRDDFDKAVKGDLADGWTVEDVWHYGGFDPAKVDRLDPDQITELLGKVKEAKPGMFTPRDVPGHGTAPNGANGANGASQRETRPPLRVEAPPSRGARDTAPGQVSYKKNELAEPGWEKARPELKAALGNGSAVLLPD